jgi:hypothetical protein
MAMRVRRPVARVRSEAGSGMALVEAALAVARK